MRHAGPVALDALEPLVAELRALPALKERSRGVFYLKSRAFLHFHENPAGLFCDVRLDPAADFTRLEVSKQAQRRDLLDRVKATLDAASSSRR